MTHTDTITTTMAAIGSGYAVVRIITGTGKISGLRQTPSQPRENASGGKRLPRPTTTRAESAVKPAHGTTACTTDTSTGNGHAAEAAGNSRTPRTPYPTGTGSSAYTT